MAFVNTLGSGGADGVTASAVPTPSNNRYPRKNETPSDSVSIETRRMVRDMQLWFN